MSAIEMMIEPRMRDLGGFTVGRVLPYARRRMVGPFIFFDEMGPAEFAPGKGIDVRPHPHIGLATVTYLFEGEIRHKDSLGFDQVIKPGDVNWMTAGRGIAHSERTDNARRDAGQKMHGIQSWIALPEDDAETDPSFHHHPRSTLPMINGDGFEMRLIAGDAFGETSPVKTFSPIFYLGVEADAGAHIPLPDNHEERALYVTSGKIEVDGEIFGKGKMLVLKEKSTPIIKTVAATKMMLLGGAPLGERLIWWNFVAATKERMEQAKAAWKTATENGFKDSVFSLPPGEVEFIPLPDQ